MRLAAAGLLAALAVALAACAPAPPLPAGPAADARGSRPQRVDPRPQLSAAQAAETTVAQVLGRHDGWHPPGDLLATAAAPPALHYRVDPGRADGRRVFATVQAAVHQAHRDAAAGRAPAQRLVIGIAPGRYAELVYLPEGPVPITLWGLGDRPEAVRIGFDLDARMPGADYAARAAAPLLQPEAPAEVAAMARACAARETIGTGCSAVLWLRRTGTQLRQLSVENHYRQDRGGPPRQPQGQHQAVALRAEGADRLQLEAVHLLGHQDTLFLEAGAMPAARPPRAFIHRSLITGDVDFIFGNATAYFLRSEVRWVGARRGLNTGYVAAPSTDQAAPFGFVFERCRFSAEGGAHGAVFLARQWFMGARCSPYRQAVPPALARCEPAGPGEANSTDRLAPATLAAVGKMRVLRSRLGPHLRSEAPWSPWQADPGAANHRPVQTDSEGAWQRLLAAGLDPAAWGWHRPQPPEPWLAEYRNQPLGHPAPPP